MSEKTKGTSVPVAQGAQNQIAANAATQPAATTNAESKKPLAEELEERLRELKRKKQLADNREVFLETDKHLKEFQKELRTQEKAGHFETPAAKLVFKGQGKNAYSLDEIFAISNVALICKFIGELRQEIAGKVQEIEAELIF
jgi:hypothetical protein